MADNNATPNAQAQTPAPLPELTIDVEHDFSGFDDAQPADDVLHDLFSLGDEADGDTEPAQTKEPTSAEAKPAEEPQGRTALERARQRYDARKAARKEASELDQLRAERDDYKKKLDLPPDPNAIKKAAEDFLARGKSPEQLAKEKKDQEFEELKAWKKQIEDEKLRTLQDQERAKDIKDLSDVLEQKADEYVYLSGSNIKPDVLHENVDLLLDSGQAKSIEEAFSIIDGWAAHYANSFKKNPRVIKKMYAEDQEAQTALLDVLTDIGLVNSKNRSAVRRAIQSAPATLSNELKNDFNPQDDGRPMTGDERLRKMQRLADELRRQGAL